MLDVIQLHVVAGYDLSEAGLLSVLPYVFNFIAVMTSGRLFDYLQVIS